MVFRPHIIRVMKLSNIYVPVRVLFSFGIAAEYRLDSHKRYHKTYRKHFPYR